MDGGGKVTGLVATTGDAGIAAFVVGTAIVFVGVIGIEIGFVGAIVVLANTTGGFVVGLATTELVGVGLIAGLECSRRNITAAEASKTVAARHAATTSALGVRRP